MEEMKGHLLLLLSSIFFASSIMCTDAIRFSIPIFTLNSMRFLIGGLFLYLLGKGIPFKVLKIRDYLWSLLRGLLGIAFYYVLETLALKFISAQMVSILVGLSFILSILYEWVKREIKITIQLIGIMLVIGAGMLGVSWIDLGNTSFMSLVFGVGSMLLANISWVGYVRLEKSKPLYVGTLQIVSLDMLIGAGCLLPIAMLEHPVKWFELEPKIILQCIYLAIIPSGLAYYFYNKAAKVMKSSICTLYLNLIPVFAVLIVTLTSTSTLTVYQWIGLAVIGGAVVYTSYYYEKNII
jgi:drug/metabolite transporter (DMT)-like permease